MQPAWHSQYSDRDSSGMVRDPDPAGYNTFFFSPKRPDQFCCPRNLLSNGYWGTFPGVKRPGRDADYSPPTIAEVKHEWSYTSTPCLCFHGVARDKLTFYFYYTFLTYP